MAKHNHLDDIYKRLSDQIIDNSCIALIGAGVSAPHRDGSKVFDGYPLASELLDALRARRRYLCRARNIGEATFLFREHEGRVHMERYLEQVYRKEGVSPLPAHELLASLELPCYVSMNFDTLLEQALLNKNRRYRAISDDSDVCRMGPGEIPVIKPHGCVSKPSTLCVAADETFSFNERVPILANLLLAWLANRTVLYLGFSLSDMDFLALLRYLKGKLGNKGYMPQGIAVVKRVSEFSQKLWSNYNVDIIEMDLTTFLQGLNARVLEARFQCKEDLEPWMKSPFFSELIRIRGLPTETQLIDALLEVIGSRFGSGPTNMPDLERDVLHAVSLVLEYRQNYSALSKIREDLIGVFRKCKEAPSCFWEELRSLQQQREDIRAKIRAKAKQTIGDAKSILLYSQSQRVLDILTELDPHLQEQIDLYIAECRPKSPTPFQDALATLRSLYRTLFRSVTLIPDVTAFHLLRQRKIDLVLMGVHAVFEGSPDRYSSFINTCGSQTITEIAETTKTPFKVVFERQKIKPDAQKSISYKEEERIWDSVPDPLFEDPAIVQRIEFRNIGYDLVPWNENIVAVTD